MLGIETEKGDSTTWSAAGWASTSLFGLIDKPPAGSTLENLLRGVDLLVCDDMRNEMADFIGVDPSTRRVIAIHAKAYDTRKATSASALHEVASQAQKNLGYMHPFFTQPPGNLGEWDRMWPDQSGPVLTRMRRRALTGAQAWDTIRTALRDPSYTRQVWLVLGNGLSKTALDRERRKASPAPQVLQTLYSLQAVWAGVSSVGAQLKVVCPD